MSEESANEKPRVDEASVPRLPAGVRLHHDVRRDQWVVLAPERVFVLDAVALEIVRRCDGEAALGAIVDALAAAYGAPRAVVLKDVVDLVQGFVDKRVMAV